MHYLFQIRNRGSGREETKAMSEVTGQAAETLLEARGIKKYFGAITALDGVSFATSAALLFFASIAAAVVPARRAAGVDPLRSLQSE